MLKNIISIFIVVIIVVAVIFAINGGLKRSMDLEDEYFFSNQGEQKTSDESKKQIISKTKQLLTENIEISSIILAEDLTFSNEELLETSNKASELLEESLLHPADQEREFLISIIKEYDNNIDKLFNALEKDDKGQLAYVISFTNEHILTWEAYFYYLHAQTKGNLMRTIKNLKEKNQELSQILLGFNPELTGKLATNRLKLLIEDIARSGRRRNSDFVRFSYSEYQDYKEFFDKHWKEDSEFKIGFVNEGYILFDSFYNMHRDVDPEHSEEVRGWLQSMREGLIETHQNEVIEMSLQDAEEAKKIINDIIKILEKQKELRKDGHIEVQTFIEQDLDSYELLLLIAFN